MLEHILFYVQFSVFHIFIYLLQVKPDLTSRQSQASSDLSRAKRIALIVANLTWVCFSYFSYFDYDVHCLFMLLLQVYIVDV